MCRVPVVTLGSARVLHIGDRKTCTAMKKTAKRSKGPTKYYRATYINNDGTREDEVFISDTLDNAFEYARASGEDGTRKLDKLLEYEEFIEALL